MARRSKVETSPHFNEIVDLLVAGYSARYVSDYLSNEYNEKISHTALNNYKKANLIRKRSESVFGGFIGRDAKAVRRR